MKITFWNEGEDQLNNNYEFGEEQVVDGEDYSFVIPADFQVLTDEEGKEIIAFSSDADEYILAAIHVMLGRTPLPLDFANFAKLVYVVTTPFI